MAKKNQAALFACFMALSVPTMVQAWTTGSVPADGVYKFTFGVDSAADGFVVPANAVYDAQGTGYYDGTANATFTYGFLGTTETSYVDDVAVVEGSGIPTAIDGFSVVQGQRIILHDAEDANGLKCVKGPLASEYLPAGASPYEGRYPVRFSMRGEERAYYAVTCTVANASLTTNANAHRNSCLLKPGDYLYVEYGHNEGGVTSYTNNLETYLADVNTAGAYLVIVSPVERRTSWNSGTSTWGRSLQGIAEAGEAWVEDKIAQGARNVAFIDLNKRYNDWMNTELQRIHTVNSEVSLNAAISYYYRSAKGANADNTHINNAGTDQAAYWAWYDTLARVAAGENAAEGSAAKVQADVLKGIAEGYQGKIGVDGVADNLPWQVTDEIINAGAAPNAFWDTPVSSGFDYANDAVVANVAASTNADGTVTISGVTMLSGATSKTLPGYVKVIGLGKGLRAKVSVSDATVIASIYPAPMIICVR